MNKNIILFSGRKSSGKSSAGKYAMAYFINKRIGTERFLVEKDKKEVCLIDSFSNNKKIYPDIPSDIVKSLADTYNVKLYSFADPLKEFCINILGLEILQCYGSDDDKNSLTHIMWDQLPKDIREKYLVPKKKGRGISYNLPVGQMTARQVMEVFGTHICRRMDGNCWARGLYQKIQSDPKIELAIITDGRFPNEISMGTEIGAKAIRLTRDPFQSSSESETALDKFPLGEYQLVIDNKNLSMKQCHSKLKEYLNKWIA